MNGYFSECFQVSPALLQRYGAFNVSLITDLPLFIDPFLLFNSKKPKYQGLHDQIIKYLMFLRDKADRGGPAWLDSMFQFLSGASRYSAYAAVCRAGRLSKYTLSGV